MLDIAKINYETNLDRVGVRQLLENVVGATVTNTDTYIGEIYLPSSSICLIHNVYAVIGRAYTSDQRLIVKLFHNSDSSNPEIVLHFSGYSGNSKNFQKPLLLRSGKWTIKIYHHTGSNADCAVEFYGNIVSL